MECGTEGQGHYKKTLAMPLQQCWQKWNSDLILHIFVPLQYPARETSLVSLQCVGATITYPSSSLGRESQNDSGKREKKKKNSINVQPSLRLLTTPHYANPAYTSPWPSAPWQNTRHAASDTPTSQTRPSLIAHTARISPFPSDPSARGPISGYNHP